ncbi:MAG: NADPH-dependent FMN reductase [Acidimicrobiales bacterium]
MVNSSGTIGIVVGNPKPRSRTREVAEAVADAAAGAVGLDGTERVTVDLADLGALLFDWSSIQVREAVDAIRGCRVVVVASPTFKASYTGLLKSFLDWFGTTDLRGVTAIPVMVGAGPHHALAVEVHLRPVLVEIGATLPTRGLYVTEPQLGSLDVVVAEWIAEAGPSLRAATGT